MPDGTVEAVMADGSVQGFTRSRWEEFLKRTAELKEPVRSDTNHPGSKVGSDR